MLRYLKSNGGRDWIGYNYDGKILEGFEWRNGANPETFGVWMWNKPFFKKQSDGEEIAILLIDTQGIFDIYLSERDCAIIVGLCLLTCSTTIFNLTAQLHSNNFQILNEFISYGLKVANNENSNEMKAKPFQNLIFLIRDYSNVEGFGFGSFGGKKMLDNRLTLNNEMHKETQLTRQHIKDCFEKLDCFLMPFIGKKAVENSYDGNLDQLEPEFIQNLQEFITNVFNPDKIMPKIIAGIPIRGTNLLNYLKSYIDAFNSDKVNIVNMMDATAEGTYAYACQEAIYRIYIKETTECLKKVNFLSKTEIARLHEEALEKAVKYLESQPKIGNPDIRKKSLERLKESIDFEYRRLRDLNNNQRENHLKKALEKALEY
jgi:atlastin